MTLIESFGLSFSSRAQEYASARPEYPPALFRRLSELPRNKDLAWDVGTGSGQAAIGLAQHFRRVFATDASSEQISHARQHPQIQYAQLPAESSALQDKSVDLVTAACAAHWFNLEAFYREVNRVASPGAVIALWTYFYPETGGKEDTAIERYYRELVGPLLSHGQNYYMRLYADLPFPFEELQAPISEMAVQWNLEQLLAFMGTYSTRLRYKELHGSDPIDLVMTELSSAWGDPQQTKELRFPLGFKVGRITT